MKKYIVDGTIVTLVCIIVYLVHTLSFQTDQSGFSIIKLYAFLYVTSLLVIIGLRVLHDLVPTLVGLLFLLLVLIKFVFAILVFPQLLGDEAINKAHFLVPYLVFLCTETILTIKWLNKS